MNQPIEFPKNVKRYVRLGKLALEDEELLKAVEYFTAAYEMKQDFDVNRLLVTSLVDIGEFDLAFEYADEMRMNYFQAVEYLAIYLQLLLHRRRFIEATSMVLTRKKTAEDPDDVTLLSGYLRQIEHTGRAYQHLEPERIKKTLNDLKKLPLINYHQQMATIKNIEILPTDIFEDLAQKLSNNQQLHQLVRSKVLEELVKIESEKSVDFRWLDGEIYPLIPSTLVLPAATRSYQIISREVERALINDNPSLLLTVTSELKLHFALLFPFADKNIKDSHLWAQSYLDEQGTSIKAEDQEVFQKICQLKQRLQAQVQQLYFQ
ncbi:hypothetical protein BAU15_10865 [Enterococcus sp. JM4C]|uniref:hypothetical protein n=1 Tax=Candidatus Enterococcus huntleyi TaxID=1857217 RepID=UPI00137985D3|nr:hypothetical protein [Enterococcus sp. JM4C]KAF1298620.1 hypothetical protein BAU15_10865 [Enterococcus sp. JM4C]